MRQWKPPQPRHSKPSHAFSKGQTLRDGDDDRAAIPLLKRAVELDPNFALAYARLGAAYFNERQMIPAREQLSKAYELRNRVSERERLYIEARYTDAVTGDVPKLVEIYSRWKQTYPRDWTAPNNLAIHYADLGEEAKAIEESLLALELNPDAAYAYGNLALTYVDMGRLDEAKAIIDQAVGRSRDGNVVHIAAVWLAAARNDSAGVQKAVEWFQRRDPVSYFRFSSAVAGRAGRMRDSRALTERCIATSTAEGNVEGAANQLLQLARAEALYGNGFAARRIVPEALAKSAERFLLALAAGALAEAGDISDARSLVDRSGREYRTDRYDCAADVTADDACGNRVGAAPACRGASGARSRRPVRLQRVPAHPALPALRSGPSARRRRSDR